jgi:hypothetical protein
MRVMLFNFLPYSGLPDDNTPVRFARSGSPPMLQNLWKPREGRYAGIRGDACQGFPPGFGVQPAGYPNTRNTLPLRSQDIHCRQIPHHGGLRGWNSKEIHRQVKD